MLFRDTNNPESAIVVPSVSSERRLYVPIGFIDDKTIASNLVLFVPGATIYHFGVLTSQMHNAHAYGRSFADDAERVAHLFTLYAEAVRLEKR